MLAALVVLWLGTDTELAERRADLAAWSSRHHVSVEALLATSPSYDPALADRIEALLEEARAATAGPGTPSALQRAEALLLDHPELPQAAWLLAERFAIEAQSLTSPDAATVSRRGELGRRASELEGPREEPAGATPHPGPDPAAVDPAAVGLALSPVPARPNDRVFIDGLPRPTGATPATSDPAALGETPLHPGRHHVRATRAGLAVWSGWVVLEAGSAWSVPDTSAACSAHDLADVTASDAGPEPAPGVLCARWAVARPTPTGGGEIAECSRSRCGRWQALTTPLRSDPIALAPEAGVAEPDAWPAWATWSLLGAGALTVTGVLLWRTGALDREAPATEFVFTGPSAPLYRF